MRRLSLKSHDLTECFAANLKHAQRFVFLLSKVRSDLHMLFNTHTLVSSFHFLLSLRVSVFLSFTLASPVDSLARVARRVRLGGIAPLALIQAASRFLFSSSNAIAIFANCDRFFQINHAAHDIFFFLFDKIL